MLSPRNASQWGYSNAAVVPSVCGSIRPSVHGTCEHNRDYTVACFFVKLGRHVNHDERMNPIDFGDQRSKVKVTMDIYANNLVNTIETKPLYFIIKLGRHINHGERMDPIDLGGQRSKVEATMDIYGNTLRNKVATKPFCAS